MSRIEWALIAALALSYVMLFLLLGLTTLYKGHLLLFVAGFFLPVLWVAGAAMGPRLNDDERSLVAAERNRLGRSGPVDETD